MNPAVAPLGPRFGAVIVKTPGTKMSDDHTAYMREVSRTLQGNPTGWVRNLIETADRAGVDIEVSARPGSRPNRDLTLFARLIDQPSGQPLFVEPSNHPQLADLDLGNQGFMPDQTPIGQVAAERLMEKVSVPLALTLGKRLELLA